MGHEIANMSTMDKPRAMLHIQSSGWCKELCFNLHKLQTSGKLCDVTIQTSDTKDIPAHSSILAAASPLLEHSISSSPGVQKLCFHNIHSGIWKLLLDYIYTGEMLLPSNHIEPILRASNFLQLNRLIDALSTICGQFQNSPLDSHTTTSKVYLDSETKNIMEVVSQSPVKKPDVQTSTQNKFETNSAKPLVSSVSTSSGNEHHVVSVPKSSESEEHNFKQCHKENQITVSHKKSLSQMDNQVHIQYGSSPIKIDQNVVASKPNDDTEVLNSSTNVTIECSVHSALDSSTIGKASVSSIHPIKEVNQSSTSSTIEVVNDAGSKKSPVQKGRSNFALNPQENEAVKKIIDIIAEVHGKMEASKRAGKGSLKKQTSNDKAHENQQTVNVQSGSRNGTASSLTCINKDDEKNCQEASAVVNNEIRITETSENDQIPLRIIESETQSCERKRNLEENMELKPCSDSRYGRNEQCNSKEVKETSYFTGKEHSNHKNIITSESSSSLVNKEECLPVKIKSVTESEQKGVGPNSVKKTVHAKNSTQKQMTTRQRQLHKLNPQIVKRGPTRQNLRKKESKSKTVTRRSPFRQLVTRSTLKKQSEATDVKLHSEALQSSKEMNTIASDKNEPGKSTPAANTSTTKIAETSQQLATHEHIGSIHNSVSNEKKEEALQSAIKGRQSKSLLAELQQELDRSKSPKKRPAVRRSSRIRNSAMSSEILNTVKKMKSMFEKNQAKQENSKNKDPECRESDLNKPQQLNWPSTEITNRRRLSLLDLAEVAVKKEHLEALASEGNKQDLNTSCISNVSSTDSSILGKITNDDNFTSDDLEVIKHNKKERRENVSHGMVLSKEAAIAKGLMKENLPSESKNDRNRIVLTVEKYPIDQKVVIHVPSPVSSLNVNTISQGGQKQNSQLYCDAMKGRENVLQVEQSLNINPPETANNSSDMTNKFDSSRHDPDVPLNLSIHSNEDHTSTNESSCVIRQSSSPMASNINGPETIESGLDMSIKSPNIMNSVAQSSPLASGSSGNSATLDLSTTSANNGPIIISKPLPSKYQAARPSYIFVCMKCDAEFPKRSLLEEHMKSENCVVPKTLESSEGIEDKDVQVCEICGSIVRESNLQQHRALCSSSLADSGFTEQDDAHIGFHDFHSASSMKKVTVPSSNVSSITIPVISSHDMKEMTKNGNSSSYKPSIQTLQNPYNNFQYSSSVDQRISRAGDEKHFDTLKDRSVVSEKVVGHKTTNNESSKPQCKNNVYGCKTCSQKFSTSLELAIHSKCYHLTLNQNPNEFEICYKCQKQVDAKNHGLSRHLWKEHKLKTIAELDYLCCSQCNFRTCESSVNKGHYRRVHGNSNKMANSLKCAYCLQGFVSRQKLEEHQLVHDWPASKPFGCHFCEQRFSKVVHLESHIPLHTGQYPYVCRICNDAFAGVMSVNKHLSAKHGLKKELFKENVTYTAYECNQLSDKNFKPAEEQDAFVVTESGLTSTEKSASWSVQQVQSDGACAVPDNLVHNVNEHSHQNESLPNKALNYEVELLEYQQDDNIAGSKSGEYFVVSLPSEPQENVRSELIYTSQRDNQSGQFTALTNEIEAYTQDLNIMGEVEISTADEPSPGGSSTNVTGYDIRNDELAMQNSESRVPVNLKPHQCPYCFKRYYNVKTLEDHLPYHTGLMPYTCCLCSQQFATLMLINRHLGKDHQVSKKMYKSYRAYVKHEANIVQAGSKTVSLSERCQHLLQVIKQRDKKVVPKEADTFEEDTNLQELLEEARKGSVVGKSDKIKEGKKRKKSSKPDDSEETQQQQQQGTSSKKKKVERRNSQLESYEFVKKLVHELNHQYGFAETDDESQISAEDVAGILESGQVVVSEQDEVQKGNAEEGVVYVVSDDQHQDGYAIIQ